MQNYTNNLNSQEYDQMSDIQRKRMEKFQKMGVGNVAERHAQMESSHAASTGSNPAKSIGMLKKIQAIKSGQLKNNFDTHIHKQDAQTGFQKIPEPRANSGPSSNQQQVQAHNPDPRFSQYQSQVSEIESMFDDGPSMSSDVIMGNSYDQGNNYDYDYNEQPTQEENYVPAFEDFVRKRKGELSSQQRPPQNNAGAPPNYGNEFAGASKSEIMEMITEVSSSIAENKIRKILSEYSGNFNQNTNKNTFSKVKGRDDIIKIGDEYFKLTKVRPKKRKY